MTKKIWVLEALKIADAFKNDSLKVIKKF